MSIIIIIEREKIERMLDTVRTNESNLIEYIFIKLGRSNAEHYVIKKDIENSHNNFFFSQSFKLINLKKCYD